MKFDKQSEDHLDRVLEEFEISPSSEDILASNENSRSSSGRESVSNAAQTMTNLRILEIDDALVLHEQPPGSLSRESNRGRGEGRESQPSAEKPSTVKAERPMALLPYNKVTEKIDLLDKKLTPHRGLREWKEGKIVGTGLDVKPLDTGHKILLFIHGTFSESDSFFNQIDKDGFLAGKAFLTWASEQYDQILTFDHPTLAVSPLVNAHELSKQMGNCGADIDVVCHSRGGLVTRWWLEALDQGAGKRRAVFVGSPLAGTGLAAPHNIKSALNMAANIGSATTAVSVAVPWLAFATGLFQVMTSVLRVAGKAPLADVVMSTVPGLAAQSRVGNNHELLSLRNSIVAFKSEYFFVLSDFESEKEGWRFWRYFRNGTVKSKAADVVTNAIFDGKNDLVVDTSSMIDLRENHIIQEDQVLDFGTQNEVMHTNYFEQDRTLEFIVKVLG